MGKVFILLLLVLACLSLAEGRRKYQDWPKRKHTNLHQRLASMRRRCPECDPPVAPRLVGGRGGRNRPGLPKHRPGARGRQYVSQVKTFLRNPNFNYLDRVARCSNSCQETCLGLEQCHQLCKTECDDVRAPWLCKANCVVNSCVTSNCTSCYQSCLAPAPSYKQTWCQRLCGNSCPSSGRRPRRRGMRCRLCSMSGCSTQNGRPREDTRDDISSFFQTTPPFKNAENDFSTLFGMSSISKELPDSLTEDFFQEAIVGYVNKMPLSN